MKLKKETGFSLIETIIALVILMVGILGTISALSFSIFSVQDSEKRSMSKEIARSTMETIFSTRDLQAFDDSPGGALYTWASIQVLSGTNGGIFIDGWKPVRENPGADGIFGTADDTCAVGVPCIINGTTNSSAVVSGYERKIEIFDITENGVTRKRRITGARTVFCRQSLKRRN